MKSLNMRAVVAGLAGVLVVGGAALAASSGNPPAPKEARDMECLIGSWKGEARMTMGEQGADLKPTLTCKRTSGDWGVLCNLRMTGVPGMGSYEETDLFGFEPSSGKYHWFSVTNAGETHDHVADVPKGNVIQWTFEGTQEGKPFKEVVSMTFGADSKTLALRGETFVAGKSTSVLTASLRK